MATSRRTHKELNEIGFHALVDALGREDAGRFIAQFRAAPAPVASDETKKSDDETLPALSVEEAHQIIRDMQDPIDQAHFL